MRHAAITFARDVAELSAAGQGWDLIFGCDMLNLAEFRALAPASVACQPAVCYFHENQLTYPDPHQRERDRHFAMTNFVSALAADAVWFNSAFHRDEFLQALRKWLHGMPEDRCLEEFATLGNRARVQSPGIDVGPPRAERVPGPIRIVWAARWERDKAPEILFEALSRLQAAGWDFRVSVLGQSFTEVPPVFASARADLAKRIDHWGFIEEHEEYVRALRQADLFVSTAIHEFFGLAACEAMGQGAIPVLPQRLAYPELLQLNDNRSHEIFFYDGTARGLISRLEHWMHKSPDDEALRLAGERVRQCISRFDWRVRASEMDQRLSRVVESTRKSRSGL